MYDEVRRHKKGGIMSFDQAENKARVFNAMVRHPLIRYAAREIQRGRWIVAQYLGDDENNFGIAKA
jgi:hypothetical protein